MSKKKINVKNFERATKVEKLIELYVIMRKLVKWNIGEKLREMEDSFRFTNIYIKFQKEKKLKKE